MPLNNSIQFATPALAIQFLEQTMEFLIAENQALEEKNAAWEQKFLDVNDRLDRMEETLVGGPKSKPKKPLGRDSRMSSKLRSEYQRLGRDHHISWNYGESYRHVDNQRVAERLLASTFTFTGSQQLCSEDRADAEAVASSRVHNFFTNCCKKFRDTQLSTEARQAKKTKNVVNSRLAKKVCNRRKAHLHNRHLFNEFEHCELFLQNAYMSAEEDGTVDEHGKPKTFLVRRPTWRSRKVNKN
ncbi:hypothetical protein G6F43_011491 [Rhizopus delemar]|nr:hypothetical protein G6F43_011491 [Rhizopus delemar]